MLTFSRFRTPTHALTAAVLAGVAVLGTACGTSSSPGMSGMHHSAAAAPSSSASSGTMPGMGHDMPVGDGLTATASGLHLAPAATVLPAGRPTVLRFQILRSDGRPVTAFEPDQTELMHLYLIRSDLTGFQHVHPSMAGEGTWSAQLASARPGSYRAYTTFTAKQATGGGVPLVLSQPLTVLGTAVPASLPAPAASTQVDGYTLTVGGQPMAGMSSTLTVTVARDGRPVTDLQPYLDTYAHLTAFHAGDLAFAHLHPRGTVSGDHGGPRLSFEALLPKPGGWRLFVQFQTGGRLHTAAITLSVQ
jgi:hypothetical protein